MALVLYNEALLGFAKSSRPNAPSLRAQRSNPGFIAPQLEAQPSSFIGRDASFLGAIKPGLLRCARNDGALGRLLFAKPNNQPLDFQGRASSFAI